LLGFFQGFRTLSWQMHYLLSSVVRYSNQS